MLWTSISFILEKIHITLILLSAISFLFYGYDCLYSKKMNLEFTRFQLSNEQRKLTGILQIIGGISLLIGLAIPLVGLLASGGLVIQMLLGFIIRLRIKDGILPSLPSFFFMILNGYLFLYFLKIYL